MTNPKTNAQRSTLDKGKKARLKHRKNLVTVVSQIQLPEPQASEVIADVDALVADSQSPKSVMIVALVRDAAKKLRKKNAK